MQNITDIKIQNTFRILDAIRFNDGRTKKEIASDTGLSFATVSNICRELREKGLIIEEQVDKSEAGIGRVPHNILLNYNDFFGVCIDMHNRGQIVLAITNLRNEIVSKKEVHLKKSTKLMDFAKECLSTTLQACVEAGLDKEQLLSLCVAVPAIYDKNTGLTVGAYDGMHVSFLEGQPLKATFEEVFEIPVFVDNETNIASMSVTSNDVLNVKNVQNLIYILCSEGLGVGIISHNKQIVGCDGYGAEICHIPIGEGNILCKTCGNIGCVESELTTSGFVTKYLGNSGWNKEEIFQLWDKFLLAVEAEDEKALAVVAENAKILGKLTSILVNLFDPEVIYIGGNISVLFERIKATIEEEVTSRLIARKANSTLILEDCDENTILYGCGEIVYNKIDFSAL